MEIPQVQRPTHRWLKIVCNRLDIVEGERKIGSSYFRVWPINTGFVEKEVIVPKRADPSQFGYRPIETKFNTIS